MRLPNKNLFPLVLSLLTSREEPVGVLDDGFDDADDLQGNCGHHLCDVAAADGEERKSSSPDHKDLHSIGDEHVFMILQKH